MSNENDRSAPDKNRTKAISFIKDNVPVVGIGASAGGLEAFEEFVGTLPADCGIACILVVHLAPSHVSILSEIVQKKTRLQVSQITDNMVIEPNRVYIIPPNKDLEVFGDTLQLFTLKKPHGFNLPIDGFFHSLAKDRGDRTIGVILSGTGTDGTAGIRAIKNAGGMVMVQDPESARHDGMPRSAIATGLVDYILPPKKMYTQLCDHLRHELRKEDSATKICSEQMTLALQKIFLLLRTATDHDFSLYKKNTICRRIEKRMQMQEIDSVDDYVIYLEKSDAEKRTLFKELLIGVTSFFRDVVPFDLLTDKYLPELLKDKQSGDQLRIWVPGCSSGEEVYSIAIVVWECMAAMGCSFEVQIFGTDLDEEAINFARAGKYPDTIAADISVERLKQFFTKEEKYYQVATNIREMIVFAPQNVIKDPPFTRLDMICCRNLLIYFDQKLQNKLLPIFHYSLNRDGLLLLGNSETISLATADLFTVVDKKWKIYKARRAEGTAHPALALPLEKPVGVQPAKEAAAPSKTGGVNTAGLLRAILAESNMAPCVVVNQAAEILYIHGRIGRFLEPAEGEVSSNILKMARPGLQPSLSRALRQLVRERREIQLKRLRVQDSGGSFEVTVTLRPLTDPQKGRDHMILLLFEELPQDENTTVSAASGSAKTEKSEELQRLEDQLQTTVEEMEAANEELKSTNEELQSTNEELQSSNEELETSKEEMQSLNEEAATVNSELQSRVDELIAANDDIKNLLDATEIAAIFLDIDLHVKRFTPKATHLFPLSLRDIGRPITHFSTSLVDVKVVERAEKVLGDLNQHESEVADVKGKIYRMRMRPYRTSDNVIDGVVVTFEDISIYKELLAALTVSEGLWRGLVENAPMGIFIMTDARFTYLNPEALRIFGVSFDKEMLEKEVVDWVDAASQHIFNTQSEALIKDKRPLSAIEQTWLRKDGSQLELVVSAAPIVYKKRDSALVFVREKL